MAADTSFRQHRPRRGGVMHRRRPRL